MKQLAAVLISLFALIQPTFSQTGAQVDPEIGRMLSARVRTDEPRFQSLRVHVKALGMQRPYNNTYDYRVLSIDISSSGLLLDEAKNEIFALSYDDAANHLKKLEGTMSAIKAILGEDSSMPGTELERQSVLDENYAPRKDLPSLRGPALRAAIASEISFDQRLFVKAHIPTQFNEIAPDHGQEATPCTDARDRLVAQEIMVERSLGYSYPSALGEPNSFFSMLDSELHLLHYAKAHELASKAYDEGQRILALCSIPYGNSNPASIIVLPTGWEQPKLLPADSSSEPQHNLDSSGFDELPEFEGSSKRVRISAAVAAGLLRQKRPPIYPAIAVAARSSGVVVLRTFVSEAGVVERAWAISGPSMLQQPAIDAVKTWQYRPYVINGVPVEVETTVNVVFSLGG